MSKTTTKPKTTNGHANGNGRAHKLTHRINGQKAAPDRRPLQARHDADRRVVMALACLEAARTVAAHFEDDGEEWLEENLWFDCRDAAAFLDMALTLFPSPAKIERPNLSDIPKHREPVAVYWLLACLDKAKDLLDDAALRDGTGDEWVPESRWLYGIAGALSHFHSVIDCETCCNDRDEAAKVRQRLEDALVNV